MTWAPRNKSEDEDDDDGDGARSKEESPDKIPESNETSAEDEGGRGGSEGAPRAKDWPRERAAGTLKSAPSHPVAPG